MEASDAAAVEDDGLAPAQVRLLTEIGMMAAGRGFPAEAKAIFESLRVLRPQRPFPYVGLAVTSLNAGDPEEAVRVLEREGLAACPGDPELRAFLGLALRSARRGSEGDRVLEDVAREAPESDGGRLARALLSRA